MSFAWFFSARDSVVKQEMHVGSFAIDFKENTEIIESIEQKIIINIDAAYPTTFAKAAVDKTTKNIYSFYIQNTGTVAAQIRLHAQVISDTGYQTPPVENSKLRPLAEQLRYAVKIYDDATAEPSWQENGGLLFNPADGTANSPVKQFFNSKLLEKKDPLKDDFFIGNKLGTLNPVQSTLNKKVHVKLLVWLDSKSTVESTGAIVDGIGVQPSLKFTINLTALQVGGEAAFLADDIKDMDSEKIPNGDIT